MEHTLRHMLPDSHAQRVLDLLVRKGMLRSSDLDAVEAPRVVLSRMTAAGMAAQASRGAAMTWTTTRTTWRN